MQLKIKLVIVLKLAWPLLFFMIEEVDQQFGSEKG